MEPLDVQWIHGSPNCNDNTDPPIQIHRYLKNIFILRQNKCVDHEYSFEAPFMYLIFGDDRVMLIDTGATSSPQLFPIGTTVQNIISTWLAEQIKQFIPLLICHSHGHSDHLLGDNQFQHFDQVTIVSHNFLDMKSYFGFENWPDQIVELDLGNRVLDIIPTPGHEEAHIAIYDRISKILFTGDTLYPGLLVIRDWDSYRKSIVRLKTFADSHKISLILGAHIEMKNEPGKWFGYPQWYQPNEHILQLETRHLIELHDAITNMAIPRVERHNDFIIQPANLSPPKLD